MFRRHRPGSGAGHQQANAKNDDDDDEEDVFSALSSRRRKKKAKTNNNNNPSQPPPADKPAAAAVSVPSDPTPASLPSSVTTQPEPTPEETLPVSSSTTSSMKRHHKEMSDSRKAKMDSLLAELQSSTNTKPTNKASRHTLGGSHVEPGQEHVTTNIFVGNLAPHMTEEELTRVFGKFGELFSVKIMWPRTVEERARQRLTGFVCYYNRLDAEDAMDALSEVDVFQNGRRLMLRWGKNVLREGQQKQRRRPVRPTEPLPPPPAAQQHSKQHPPPPFVPPTIRSTATGPGAVLPSTLPQPDGVSRIHVQIPSDSKRQKFISLIASFVAKDGTDLEQMLVQQQNQQQTSPEDFRFLSYPQHQGDDDLARIRQEHIYYKWRVYSYAQGDTEYRWRTEPFVMIASPDPSRGGGGCLWIPPPVNEAAARQEEAARLQEQEQGERRREERRRQRNQRPDLLLRAPKSRQFQKQRSLSPAELDEWHTLTRTRLCASRQAIAAAMSFCFEKCAVAAPQICHLLRELFITSHQEEGFVSVESRISRLYLLSDVLFNSQQPGIRNAFFFRDAIEQWAPDVFASLGNNRNVVASSRVAHHKMQKAVSAVLAAWTNWSVYNPTFLDELQAKFEGRVTLEMQIKQEKAEKDENEIILDSEHANEPNEPVTSIAPDSDEVTEQPANTAPMGEWKEVALGEDGDDDENERDDSNGSVIQDRPNSALAGKSSKLDPIICKQEESTKKDPLDNEDPDGEPLEDEDADGEPLGDKEADGEPLEDEDADGEPLQDDDPDGEPLEDEDADGEPLGDKDADGEPLEDEDADGKPLEDENADGERLN